MPLEGMLGDGRCPQAPPVAAAHQVLAGGRSHLCPPLLDSSCSRGSTALLSCNNILGMLQLRPRPATVDIKLTFRAGINSSALTERAQCWTIAGLKRQLTSST